VSLDVLGLSTGVEDFSVAQAFALLTDLYGKVDDHAARIAAPLDLLCHAGCSGCCRQSVWMTTLEALFIIHHLQAQHPADVFGALVQQGVLTFEAHRERILQFGHAECPGAPALSAEDAAPRARPLDRILSAKALQFDCPVLDGAGLCRAYPARELRGRLFAVSRLKSRDEYYACDLLGSHLDGREVTLLDAESINAWLHLYPLTSTEQVLPYFLWRYAPLLLEQP
jgi:hypothetical protein